MDIKEYIDMELEGVKRGISRVLNGLTQEEIAWRPACGCNSIGLILFHIARSEDSFVQKTLKGSSEVWSTGKWYQKLNLSENDAGAHYTVDQVNAFRVPPVADILAYYDAVRKETLEYLKNLKPEDFDKKVKLPFGEFSVAGIFSIIANHSSQHVGEMSYLRGLQRGMDK
ncbi:MAG: DinB family protein [Dehalococcoidales bacterium]|jgi:hypothetical protein|nr:DinB family protein [Dehalococcoidales bacterium]